jgi:hypothetical protein
MSNEESATASMLSRTAAHIHQLFAISPEQSQQEALDLLSTIEAKGGECTSWGVIANLVETHLGQSLQWRHTSEKVAAENRRKDTVASYNSHIESGRSAWHKKW